MSGFSSMFSQLLKLFPRTEFQALVQRTHAERHARGFTCWGQFVAMLFCQLGRAHSLREICGGLRSSEGKLKHLGISRETDRNKREALLRQIQKIAYDRVMFVPIWEFAQLYGRGPRVQESALGVIPYMPFSAPYEDVRLKGK